MEIDCILLLDEKKTPFVFIINWSRSNIQLTDNCFSTTMNFLWPFMVLVSQSTYYWTDLHRLLEKALRLWNRSNEADILGRAIRGESPQELHKILHDNVQILNYFFVLRTKAWFKLVIGQGLLGIEDYWCRFESAKSRGMIHFTPFSWILLNYQLVAANFHIA